MAILNFKTARPSGVCQIASTRPTGPQAVIHADDPIAWHQTIENALSMALHLVRNHQTPKDLQAATAKAVLACDLLQRQFTQTGGA